MYSICSFLYALSSSLFAFVSFWVLVLVGFLLLDRDAVFMFFSFFRTTNVSHGTLYLALSLVDMRSAAAASMWPLTKFLYFSFAVSVSDIS